MQRRRSTATRAANCVDVFGLSRPQMINAKMFDHTVITENHCNKVIKLKVCY
jgi:hypothetical protein